MIVAIIRPDRLSDTLQTLLHRADINGLTVHRVQGHGGETDIVETYRGTTVKTELHDKMRIEIGVSEPFVDATVEAIMSAARRGRGRTTGPPSCPSPDPLPLDEMASYASTRSTGASSSVSSSV